MRTNLNKSCLFILKNIELSWKMLSQKTLKGEVLKEARPVFYIADFAFHHSTCFSTQYKNQNNMLLKDQLFSKHR